MEPGAGPVAGQPQESCGAIPTSGTTVGIELTIQGRTEWPAVWTALGTTRPVLVSIRNVGDDPLTVWTPAVVGIGGGSFITTEPGPSSLFPTTWRVDPSEAIELPASLPDRSCKGVRLDAGRYEFMPLVAIVRGDDVEVVSGTSTTALYR